MKRISFFRLGCSLLLVALGVSGSIMRGELSGVASDRAGSAVLWRDPGESRRDLYYGPGGRENVPDGKFTFVEEIAGGASPKFDVRDEDGTQWRVKLGDEVRSETAATRLLWAAGYFADENYYFAELRIEGMKPLRRGQEFVTGDGTIRGARMERRPKHRKQIGTWSWFENPFVGTRELNGLKIMMALINHWDLKSDNNAIYEENGEHRYVVSDVGASFGRTGHHFKRTKDNLQHYADSDFIRKTTPDTVDFHLKSRPMFFEAVLLPRYRQQAKREKIVKGIPREHARWMGQMLAGLSEQQIRDCFRAAGYKPEEADGYTVTLKQRIAQLNRL